MELTIDRELQQGVVAYKEGNLQKAERLYRAILKARPPHLDANYNLGLLAAAVNKLELALPLFKSALEANPATEQFWLSYINALINGAQIEKEQHVLSDGKKRGLAGDKFTALEEQMKAASPEFEGNQTMKNEYSSEIELRETGRYEEAQEWLTKFIESDPSAPEAWSMLSQIQLPNNKIAESEMALSVAKSLNSTLPSVYLNQTRLLFKKSEFARALEEAQYAYKKTSGDPESSLVLAAIKDAEMTISLKSHPLYMWAPLGALGFQSKNTFGAINA